MINKKYSQFIKESIDYSDIILDVKDILQELEDEGFNVLVVEHPHILIIMIDNKIHYSVTEDDNDYVKEGNKFIGSDNIHIIEQCVSYLKSKLKPLGKNIHIHFGKGKRWYTSSYTRFIHMIKSGDNISSLKFSFIK